MYTCYNGILFAFKLFINTTSAHTDYQHLYYQAQQIIAELQLQNQSLQLQINELKKIVFGSQGEKFIAAGNNNGSIQPDLFPNDKLGQWEVIKTTVIKQHEKKQAALKVNHPGRNPLPQTLRREVIELQPTENVSDLKPIGTEITEVLEYQPGELFVKQYVRPEYIKTSADGLNARRIIAALPSLPLEKAIAGPSLLTHLLVSKFIDHQPVYRLLGIFKRQQVSIHYSTASGWMKDACELLYPVYDLHCKEILQTNYLGVDETTIKVLDKDKKNSTHQGYYWVYYDTQRKLALFDYQPGRGALYPKSMLHNFKGYLQSDGYDAYETFDKVEGITTLCCWAHARRKFYEAKDYDNSNAEIVLEQIQQLYKIEAHCKEQNFTPEQIKSYRLQHAVAVLNPLHEILKDMLIKLLAGNPLIKAISYTLKRWEKLCLYTTNGILQIDNNLVENSIRPVALGRKNYLFAGSHERAQDAAMLYSLFATCRLHNVNPEKWLTSLFENIKNTPKEQLHLLLPQNYAARSNEQ